ncbi:MAG: hypothetical protein QNJ97_12280 [Myxococcota bacterium]|nr:hypothetical protein [Myxococcota bacterium]
MIESLRNLIAGLSERERRMVAILGGAFIVFILFLFVFLVQSKIGDLAEQTEITAQALRLIEEKEADYLNQKREQQRLQSQGKVKPTPLRTLIDKISKQLDVTVPDVKELPDQRHGTLWVEHGVELSMRAIGIKNLTRFMEEVEKNRRRFPVAITKLEIRNRRRTQDTYDVKMVISTYEQTANGQTPSKRLAGASRKGGI